MGHTALTCIIHYTLSTSNTRKKLDQEEKLSTSIPLTKSWGLNNTMSLTHRTDFAFSYYIHFILLKGWSILYYIAIWHCFKLIWSSLTQSFFFPSPCVSPLQQPSRDFRPCTLVPYRKVLYFMWKWNAKGDCTETSAVTKGSGDWWKYLSEQTLAERYDTTSLHSNFLLTSREASFLGATAVIRCWWILGLNLTRSKMDPTPVMLRFSSKCEQLLPPKLLHKHGLRNKYSHV